MTPPQILSSPSVGSVRSTTTVRDSPSSMVSMALCQTSASPHPPPIVPANVPSGRSSITAPVDRGVEPDVSDTVAKNSEMKEVPNRYVPKGEMFYKIPLKRAALMRFNQ